MSIATSFYVDCNIGLSMWIATSLFIICNTPLSVVVVCYALAENRGQNGLDYNHLENAHENKQKNSDSKDGQSADYQRGYTEQLIHDILSSDNNNLKQHKTT